MADGTAIDGETTLPPWGRAVAVPARSAIVFTEAMTRAYRTAPTISLPATRAGCLRCYGHGRRADSTLPWRSEHSSRKTIFYKYTDHLVDRVFARSVYSARPACTAVIR